jgi:hypothetical protein
VTLWAEKRLSAQRVQADHEEKQDLAEAMVRQPIGTGVQ